MSAAEEWRPVVGYEESYEVSSFGQIRSKARIERVVTRTQGEYFRRRGEKILRPCRDEDGYLRVKLCRDAEVKGFGAHTLVCAAFHGPRPPGHEVAHNDGCRANNVEANLRWATPTENQGDRYHHDTALLGEKNPLAVLTAEDVMEIRSKLASRTATDVSRDYGVTPECIMAIRARKTWKHIP